MSRLPDGRAERLRALLQLCPARLYHGSPQALHLPLFLMGLQSLAHHRPPDKLPGHEHSSVNTSQKRCPAAPQVRAETSGPCLAAATPSLTGGRAAACAQRTALTLTGLSRAPAALLQCSWGYASVT